MLCPKCGSEIPDGSSFCPKCGVAIAQPSSISASVGRALGKASMRSINAMIFGIVSIACIPLLGPIALILGAMELNKIKKGLSSASGRPYALVGLILGIIASVMIVFIIPILAAIAIPNFLTAKNRAQVYRTQAELRMCAVALESYYVDNNAYPLPDYDGQQNPVVPHILTTPVSYVTSIPNDPFSFKRNQIYHYYTGIIEEEEKPYWILTGRGPDRKSDIEVTRYNPQYPDWQEPYLILKSYDPTNGTVSQGDIFRTGPEATD
ncbi:MAG: zinc-ribbon domain-containing protein [bacterium]|nr:zinc-ribbon domain-containing protein [bacterium]